MRITASMTRALSLVLLLAAGGVGQPPPNDTPYTAQAIGEGYWPGTNVGAGTDWWTASCEGWERDVWYLYTPSLSGFVRASLCPKTGTATFDTLLAALEVQTFSEIAFNDDALGTASEIVFPVQAGVAVYLAVAGRRGQQGTFTLGVTFPTPPWNDDPGFSFGYYNPWISTAYPVETGANGPFSIVGATPSAWYAPTCGQGGPTGADLWFSWIAPCTGLVEITTCGSSFDTVLSVWNGLGLGSGCMMPPCFYPSQIACNDDATLGLCQGTGASRVTVDVFAGNPYDICVASAQQGSSGIFFLNIQSCFALKLSSPFGEGSLLLQTVNGTAQQPYFTALTTNAGGFPNGWFFGVDIPLAELLAELLYPGGFPFMGTLDYQGDSPPLLLTAGVPPGLSLYGVTMVLDPLNGSVIWPALPVAHTTP